jgi:hypothetical protein
MMATARDDSRDQSTLFVFGANFGVPEAVGTDPAGLHGVRVGDQSCAGVQWLGDGSLRCSLSGQFIVGSYVVAVTVDGMNSSTSAGVVEIGMACPSGYYGRTGEPCLPCPSGAQCVGFGTDPQALVRVACSWLGSCWMKWWRGEKERGAASMSPLSCLGSMAPPLYVWKFCVFSGGGGYRR